MAQAKISPETTYSRCKSGRRPDIGGMYFRSSWEANYARYLNWLKDLGEIKKWEYEADTFEFHNVKRGTRFYTPDFKIWENDGSINYHEVKGWLDDKSKIKLKRMERYYPNVKIILIAEREYRSIAKKICAFFPEWEYGKNGY